eukprot:CAMPEP_0174919098 /NCGR_PEP_ID=MMETSP1355-20121228/3474_1 /TAXON_ID=464990 /ORGANISM="Hemiselmis tepida, Strain CCMP443" /LENGTH=355 /DNA_ID=CAMNT_0016164307 /DNA_START=96 /DNA_END=1159 /DNA_ORIENTATION=-
MLGAQEWGEQAYLNRPEEGGDELDGGLWAVDGQGPEDDAAFVTVRDVHGFSLAPVMLPGTPGTVAYATGTFFVVWNWKADRKVVHRQHRHPITCLSMNHNGTAIVTADADRILLWDTQTWTVTSRAVLPKGKSEPGKDPPEGPNGVAKRVKAFEVIRAAFLGGAYGQVVSLERSTEISAVQCLRVWQADGAVLRTLTDRHVSQDPVHSLRAMHDSGRIYLCSNGLVSSFQCVDNRLGLGGPRGGGIVPGWSMPCVAKEVVFVGVEVASAVGWVLLVQSDGSVTVVSEAGERLRTVRRESAVFTSSCMDGPDCLLVGTARGTVLWYNVPSMDVWRRVPYDLELRDSMQARMDVGDG